MSDYLSAMMSTQHEVKEVRKPASTDETKKLEQAQKTLGEKFDTVMRIVSLFSNANTLEENLQIFVNQGQVIIPFEALEVMKLDESEEHLLLYSICYEGKIKWDIRLNYKGTELEEIIKQKRVSCIGNIQEEIDFPVSDVVHMYNISSILQVPISTQDRFWGFLNLYNRKIDVFKQNHIEIAQFFSNLLATYFENDLLKERMSLFKSVKKEESESDYGVSLYLRQELKILNEKIVQNCESFREKYKGRINVKQMELVDEIKELAEMGFRRCGHLEEYLLLTGEHIFLDRRKIDLNRSISDAIEKLKSALEDKALRIFFEIDKKFPPVIADYKRLQRILITVLENGIEASRHGGTIRVNVTKEEDDMALIAIYNLGEDPLSSNDFLNIFTPFGRLLHTISPKMGKVILNLPIAKVLVEYMGGTIWIESPKDEGTTVFITLPTK